MRQTFGCRPFTAGFFGSSLERGCLSEGELKRARVLTCAHSGEFLHRGRRWTDTDLSLEDGLVDKLRIGANGCAVSLARRNYFNTFLFKSVGFRGSSLGHN